MKAIVCFLVFLCAEQQLSALHLSANEGPSSKLSVASPAFDDDEEMWSQTLLSLMADNTTDNTTYQTPSLGFSFSDPIAGALGISATMLLIGDLFKFIMTIVTQITRHNNVIVASKASKAAVPRTQVHESRRQILKYVFMEMIPLVWTIAAAVPIIYSHVVSGGKLIQRNEGMAILSAVFIAVRILWIGVSIVLRFMVMFRSGKEGRTVSTKMGLGYAAAVSMGINPKKKSDQQVISKQPADKKKSSTLGGLMKAFFVFNIISMVGMFGTLVTFSLVLSRKCRVPTISAVDSRVVLASACSPGALMANGDSCYVTCNGARFNGTQPSCVDGTFNIGILTCDA